MGSFEPVEPVGAEQDEVDQQRQRKQEDTQGHENAPRVEQQPYTPPVPASYASKEIAWETIVPAPSSMDDA